MRFAVLGSGSKGNCLVVDGGGAVVLIDAGYSPRETRARLRGLDLDLTDLDALFITHGHGDHVKGARQIAGALGIRTWATQETAKFTSSFTKLKNHVPLVGGETIRVGGLSIKAVKTPHDEPGSVCYVVDDGDEAFAIVTDLGWADPAVGNALHGVDSLMVEFNHDLHMLQTGPYTAHLKRRIASRFGHVSNDDGAALLQMATSTALSRVLCAHLSEVNNTPDKALDKARAVVDGKDVDVACAPQHCATPWLRVRRRKVSRVRAQLALAEARADDARPDDAARPAPPATASVTASVTASATNATNATGRPPLPASLVREPKPGARPISYAAQISLFTAPTSTTTKKERA